MKSPTRVTAPPSTFRGLGVALLAIALFAQGCGYALVGRASNIPDDIRKIYVEPLVNQTQRQQVEQLLTQAIVDELVTRRRFEVINDLADADAILRGKVLQVAIRPVTFDTAGLADNFEIAINADMRFERPPTGGDVDPEVIWKNARYVFRQDYPLENAGALSFFDRENLAIEETSERFAETLVTDLLEGF
ncbi:MAG: LPS assembly lipoprotein LptE [Acidobacteriota bacterium]